MVEEVRVGNDRRGGLVEAWRRKGSGLCVTAAWFTTRHVVS